LIFLLFPVFLKTALSFYNGLFLDIAESYDKEEYLDEIFTTKSVKYLIGSSLLTHNYEDTQSTVEKSIKNVPLSGFQRTTKSSKPILHPFNESFSGTREILTRESTPLDIFQLFFFRRIDFLHNK
jgi:hypothetical protein